MNQTVSFLLDSTTSTATEREKDTTQEYLTVAIARGNSYRWLDLIATREAHGRILVSEPRTGAFGSGSTLETALNELMSMLSEMYEHLSQSHRLSAALSNNLQFLEFFAP